MPFELALSGTDAWWKQKARRKKKKSSANIMAYRGHIALRSQSHYERTLIQLFHVSTPEKKQSVRF